MKILLTLLMLSLSGCAWFEALPPVEVCVLYKGKKICASKVDGKWSFNVALTAEEQGEIVKALEE